VMPALAERYAVANDHASDRRIRRRIGDRTRGEFRRAGQIGGVARYGVTSTPCQKATCPVIFFASALVSG